jgi:hypothetical protein
LLRFNFNTATFILWVATPLNKRSVFFISRNTTLKTKYVKNSVFVVKEKIRERWRTHTDTIARTIYIYKDKGRITSKEVKTEETIFTTLFKHIKFLVLVMVIVFLFVVCRSCLKQR